MPRIAHSISHRAVAPPAMDPAAAFRAGGAPRCRSTRHLSPARVPGDLAGRVVLGAQVEVGVPRFRLRRGFVVELSERERESSGCRTSPSVPDDALLGFPTSSPRARWVAACFAIRRRWVAVLKRLAMPGGTKGLCAPGADLPCGAQDPVMRLRCPARHASPPGAASRRAAQIRGRRRLPSTTFAPGVAARSCTAETGKTEVYLPQRGAGRARGGRPGRSGAGAGDRARLAGRSRASAAASAARVGRAALVSRRSASGGATGSWRDARGAGRRGRRALGGVRAAAAPPADRGRRGAQSRPTSRARQLRYHGRDTAVRRARCCGIPVVLGSATPSIESLRQRRAAKYRRSGLPPLASIAGHADGRAAGRPASVKASTAALLSRLLRVALTELVSSAASRRSCILNRRGHCHITQCRTCGFVAECPPATSRSRSTSDPRAWRCHYCGSSARPFQRRAARSAWRAMLRFAGAGTQRAEREIARGAPGGARVLRLDAPTSRAARGTPAPRCSRRSPRGDADVLVGDADDREGPRLSARHARRRARRRRGAPPARLPRRRAHLPAPGPGVGTRRPRPAPGEVPGPDLHAGASRRSWPRRLQQDARATSSPASSTIRREAGYPPYTRLVALPVLGCGRGARSSARGGARGRRAAQGEDARAIDVLGPAPQALAATAWPASLARAASRVERAPRAARRAARGALEALRAVARAIGARRRRRRSDRRPLVS